MNALETKRHLRPSGSATFVGRLTVGRTNAGDSIRTRFGRHVAVSSRYAKVVQDRGGKVVFECHKPLLKLVGMCRGIDQLVGRGDPLPPFDVYAPLLSLPRFSARRWKTFLQKSLSYSDPELVETCVRNSTTGGPRFQIGINWQETKIQRGQVPFAAAEAFRTESSDAGRTCVQLQRGPASENASAGDQWKIIDLGTNWTAPWRVHDTTAVMKSLDLVITSDTAMPRPGRRA